MIWKQRTTGSKKWSSGPNSNITAVYSPLPVGMGGRSSGAGDWQVMLVPMTMAGCGGRSPKTQDRDSTLVRAGSWTTDRVTLETTNNTVR